MSDSSPIFRRRPRPPLPSATTPSASSPQHKKNKASPKPKKKKTAKKVVKQRHHRKIRRQGRLNCKLLDHQAKERSDDECDNSEDDADASDDSVVHPNLDSPDGSPSLYAASMGSQAEALGFTVPLHKVRHQDRPDLADQILQSMASRKSKSFRDYLARVRDGVGQEGAHVLHLTEPSPSVTAPPPPITAPSPALPPPIPVPVPLSAASRAITTHQLNLFPLFQQTADINIIPETPIIPMDGLTRATGRLRLRKADKITCESNVQTSPRGCDASVETSPLSGVDAATQTLALEPVTLADLKAEMRALLLVLFDVLSAAI